jgi:Amt family ammonium transporter
MKACRLATLLFIALLACWLSSNRAVSQTPLRAEQLPQPRVKADTETTKRKAPEATSSSPDPAVVEIKKALADANKEIIKTNQAINELKSSVKGDDLQKAFADVKTANEKIAALEKGSEENKKATADAATTAGTGIDRGDTAWMMTASAFVLLMVPGLALFYGGMVRRKNVLATMMQSMAALAVIGIFWIAIGYSLAFGAPLIKLDLFGVKDAGLIGWNWDLVFLKGIAFDTKLPNNNIPIYAHVLFQGMFAIITPALISGAIAERIRFWPFCIYMLLWVTFVYCPLAHMVWAYDWFDTTVVAAKQGKAAIGLLGKMGALDFAGGTVVHIAAGFAGLACCFILGKRAGYPKMVAHPNSMVLTLLGAGILWFGWFGFNAGSAVNSTAQAVSAFAATQAAAAAAGLGWMLVEWIHKGKPTALGLASGIVAGLVAVTPASGFVYMWAGIIIGLFAAIICYGAVALKNKLGYDDSLDAFGVHGVGGFFGALLTGVFATTAIYSDGGDGPFAYSYHRSRFESMDKLIAEAKAKSDAANKDLNNAEEAVKAASEQAKTELNKTATEKKEFADDKAAVLANLTKEKETLEAKINKQDDKENGGKDKKTGMSQVWIQLKAACISVVFAFTVSFLLAAVTQVITRNHFKTDEKGESEGLDRTEHGEVGFDFGLATESVAVISAVPKAADVPRGNGRFDLLVTGAEHAELMKAWTALCQPTKEPSDPNFLAVYPYVTTIRGTKFRCRGGNPEELAKRLAILFTKHVGKEVKATKVV